MTRRSAGFTLIEVMVGAVVSLIVIGAVMESFLAQQKSMQSLDISREASNGARDTMLSMQEAIGRAGYGIDPRYAFDLRNYNCTSYTGSTTSTNACRDRVNAPDELVFVERDPNYYWAGTPTSTVQGCNDASSPCTGHAWQVTNFTTASPWQVTINARAGDLFLVGQVVELTCAKGASPTMGTVKTMASGTGTLTLTLLDTVVSNHYTDNLAATHDTCFDSGNAAPNNAAPGVSLFLVNRYRYFVTTLNGDPWLMLDRGLDYNKNGITPENGGDLADLIPIAHGGEDLQISYLLKPDPSGVTAAPDLPLGGGNWVIGDLAGNVEEPNPFAAAPLQNTADTDPSRFTTNPANVRGVRMRLTVRSLATDRSQGTTWPGDLPGAVPTDNLVNSTATPTPVENRNDYTAVALGHFRRFNTSTVVATPNLNSKDPFIF